MVMMMTGRTTIQTTMLSMIKRMVVVGGCLANPHEEPHGDLKYYEDHDEHGNDNEDDEDAIDDKEGCGGGRTGHCSAHRSLATKRY